MDWTAADVAQRLSGSGKSRSRKKGRSWMAPCPAHSDDKPSLHLTDGRVGLLWHCHAGCSQDEVREALVSVVGGGEAVQRAAPKAKTVIADRFELHIPSADEAGKIGRDDFYHHVLGAPSAIWPYTDTTGRPVLFVARYKVEDGKEIVPWSWHSRNGLPPRFMMRNWEDKRPLYNLKELAERPEAPVLYVEGEKAAEAARKLFPAFVVTTHCGGGCAYEKTDLEPLRGRLVVVQPDADAPGKKMAEGIWMTLKGIARRCTVMEWPTAWPDGSVYRIADGDDAHDHRERGWTHEKLREAKAAGLVVFEEPDPTNQFGEGTPSPKWGHVTVSGDRVRLEYENRVVAECGIAGWPHVVGALETTVNRRVVANRCPPGRFPRRDGTAAIAFAFTGEVYSLIELVGRGGDVNACLQTWLGMHPYMRGKAFAALERQIRREEREAA